MAPSCTVLAGDSRFVLPQLPDGSIDSVVTDPPYGLADMPVSKVTAALEAWLRGDRSHIPDGRGFMGRSWDRFVPPPALWDETFRVLRPGSHMAVFCAPRMQDLMGVSIRLAGFDHDRLVELGTNVRTVYVAGAEAPDRVAQLVDDSYVSDLADAVAGNLGGQVGIAPRLFLKKLVGDVMDKVDLHAEFDPREHYQLTVGDAELLEVERNLQRGGTIDDIELDLSSGDS